MCGCPAAHVQALRNPGMRLRHWEQVSSQLGFPLQPDSKFTLKKAEVGAGGGGGRRQTREAVDM
jgi:hypothetical protein